VQADVNEPYDWGAEVDIGTGVDARFHWDAVVNDVAEVNGNLNGFVGVTFGASANGDFD
jgi:hypothetical protein